MCVLTGPGNTTDFSGWDGAAGQPSGDLMEMGGDTTFGDDGFDLFRAAPPAGEVPRGVPSLADIAAADEVHTQPGSHALHLSESEFRPPICAKRLFEPKVLALAPQWSTAARASGCPASRLTKPSGQEEGSAQSHLNQHYFHTARTQALRS